MRHHGIPVVLAALTLGVAPATVSGQAPGTEAGFERHLFPPDLIMRNQGRIDLTAEQRSTITEAIQALQRQVVDLQWNIEEAGQALADLLAGPAVDEGAALEQIDRILNLEREVKRAHLRMLIRIKNTLLPEQQTRLRSLQQAMPRNGRRE